VRRRPDPRVPDNPRGCAAWGTALLILLAFASCGVLSGCASMDKVNERVDQLETNLSDLNAKFRQYVESDARSAALTAEAQADIGRAIEALRRYIERVR
jgi:outer membrane murein-binding lipoprotein Lpp